MNVIDQIRTVVQKDGRSVSQLAKQAGIHKSQVVRFKNGERGLTTRSLDALCMVLGIEIVAKEATDGR